MDTTSILERLELILDDSKAGILATVDSQGNPDMRWMTPVLIKERPGSLFAVTSPAFLKASQIKSRPDVQWMLQTKSLTEILTIKGHINIIDNPSIRAEIIEKAGKKLSFFWKVNSGMDFVVLETVIKEAFYFNTVKNLKEKVLFSGMEVV